METSVSTARERALANADTQVKKGFGMQMQTGELNVFEDGDVFTIPECEIKEIDGEKHLVFKGTNEDMVITEPMKVRGEIQRRNGKAVELSYIFVDVKRGNDSTSARLFPSLFWKSRRAQYKKDASSDTYVKDAQPAHVKSFGTVIDEAMTYASVDEAISKLSGKPMKYNRHGICSPVYNENRSEFPDTLPSSEINDKDFIPEVNFI